MKKLLDGRSNLLMEIASECKKWLQGYSIEKLKSLVDSTVGQEDDALVADIECLRGKIEESDAWVRAARDDQHRADNRLDRVTRLAEQLRTSKYTSANVEYRSTQDVESLFSGIVIGELSVADIMPSLTSCRFFKEPVRHEPLVGHYV